MQRRLPGADREIPAVWVDRHERRFGGAARSCLDLKIGIQQHEPGIFGLDQQSDQAAVVADGGGVDPIRHAGERERFALNAQEIELIAFIPGEYRSSLASKGDALERRVGNHRPGGRWLQTRGRPAGQSRSSVFPGGTTVPEVFLQRGSGLTSFRRPGDLGT